MVQLFMMSAPIFCSVGTKLPCRLLQFRGPGPAPCLAPLEHDFALTQIFGHTAAMSKPAFSSVDHRSSASYGATLVVLVTRHVPPRKSKHIVQLADYTGPMSVLPAIFGNKPRTRYGSTFIRHPNSPRLSHSDGKIWPLRAHSCLTQWTEQWLGHLHNASCFGVESAPMTPHVDGANAPW